MPEKAEAVSASLTTNRNCTIEIYNATYKYGLINPKVFMDSGFSNHPPQPTIRPSMSEVCSFTKDDNTATGAVGVLTYDIFKLQEHCCNERLVIMFSVPFDQNLYKNRLAVGVVSRARDCDKELYKLFYDGKDFSCFVRSENSSSGLEFEKEGCILRASMSTVGKAIVKVELY
ncbi:uncharacterized protein KZ484_003921 [Pholidichthys leucotaenia]